jgi:hypothetical protein
VTRGAQCERLRGTFVRWVLDGRTCDEVTGDAVRTTPDDLAMRILRLEHRYGTIFAAIQAAQLAGTTETEQQPKERTPFALAAASHALVQRIHQHVADDASSAVLAGVKLPPWPELCAASLPADLRVQTGILVAVKLVCARKHVALAVTPASDANIAHRHAFEVFRLATPAGARVG